MATLSIIFERYKKIVKDLWPQGFAWDGVRSNDSEIDKINCVIATEIQNIDTRITRLLREANPLSTFEMIEDWELFLGIPDECTPDNYEPSIAERRLRILQKLTTGGGQNAAFYKKILSQLGYDAEVVDVKDFKDFRVGVSVIGDRLTNGSNPATGWAYTFAIEAPAPPSRFFRVGQSSVGERLVLVENQELECVVTKFKPAHMNVLFSYGTNL